MKNYDEAKFNNLSQSHALPQVKRDQRFFKNRIKVVVVLIGTLILLIGITRPNIAAKAI